MKRTDVLKTAHSLVTGEREEQHGRPAETFTQVAVLWSDYLDHQISDVDVAMLLALLKIARQRGNPANSDNYIDGCGYLAIAAELSSSGDEPVAEPPEQHVTTDSPHTDNRVSHTSVAYRDE